MTVIAETPQQRNLCKRGCGNGTASQTAITCGRDECRIGSRLTLTSTGCLEFGGHRNALGYGNVWFRGKTWLAHRAMWTLRRGEIPEARELAHKCDNPPCCNDAHLFVATRQQNETDMVEKRRHFRVIPESVVALFKASIAAGEHRYSAADRLGISRRHARRILTGAARAEVAA